MITCSKRFIYLFFKIKYVEIVDPRIRVGHFVRENWVGLLMCLVVLYFRVVEVTVLFCSRSSGA